MHTSPKVKPRTCPDCGNAPVSHIFHKINVVIDTALMKLNMRTRRMQVVVEPLAYRFVNAFFPLFFKSLAALRIGKILTVLPEDVSQRERVFWDEGVRRGVTVWAYRPFSKSNVFTVAQHNGKTIVYDTIPRPGPYSSAGSNWMDDKSECHKVFEKYGIPMAKAVEVSTDMGAEKAFHSLRKPVIVKPSQGSRSRHTTTHIETLSEFMRAFTKAKQLSPWVMVEEELDGFVYRGTVIGGKVIGILRREPALVVGDGKHTVEELIVIENQNPKRKGPIFHTIEVHTEEHEKELERQELKFTSIPEKGRTIPLSQKASRGLGGGATDVTDEAHPEITRTLEKIAEVLEDPLVGVDFILRDIQKPWSAQSRSGVIECNGAPFIDLHLSPLVGKPRNTPGALWELIFPALKTSKRK